MTLSAIDGLHTSGIDKDSDDAKERFRSVAGWLFFLGIAGIITQSILVIVRGLYYADIIKHYFLVFLILVSLW